MWTPYLSKISNYADAILFVGLAAIWGTAYLAIDVGLRSTPPVTLAALRYDVAGAVLLVAALAGPVRRGGRWRPRTAEEWKLVAEGGLLVVGFHFALLFVGQGYVSGGVASVVMSLTPVLTPLFALVLLSDERLDTRETVGVLLGLLGVIVVASPSPSAGSGAESGGKIALGVGLLFLSAASLALGSVLTRRHETGMGVVPTQAWMMGLGALVLDALVVVLPGESFARVEPSVALVASLAYLSVVASVGGFVAYFHLLDRFGPNEATLVSYVVPAFAALSQWVVLGEAVSAATAAGFVVILLGFATVKWRALRRAVTPTPDRVTAVPGSSTDDAVVVGGNAYYRAAD